MLAHWNVFSNVEPTTKILQALDELHELHRRRRCLFRMELHYGNVVSAAAPSSRQKALVGNEVIFAFQMQKIAWVLVGHPA